MIEKLLSVAIKTRFLDEKMALLKDKDRRLILIGKYTESGVDKSDKVCIRLALNKLVHHDQITVGVEEWTCVVVPGTEDEKRAGTNRRISLGQHKVDRIIVSVDGTEWKSAWHFDIDLFVLLNEMLRVLEE